MKVYQGILVILLFSTLVSSAPPFLEQTAFTTGFNLKVPIKETFKLGEGYEFEVHIFNISNGMPIYSNTSCYYHLYNQSGNHIAETVMFSKGVTAQVNWPKAENLEKARSFDERLPE